MAPKEIHCQFWSVVRGVVIDNHHRNPFQRLIDDGPQTIEDERRTVEQGDDDYNIPAPWRLTFENHLA
jgi:hypothetical protein